MNSPTSLRRVVAIVKRIAGMPDYDAYVAHLREEHPECAIPSESEYYTMYLDGRYNGGMNRCC